MTRRVKDLQVGKWNRLRVRKSAVVHLFKFILSSDLIVIHLLCDVSDLMFLFDGVKKGKTVALHQSDEPPDLLAAFHSNPNGNANVAR